jgi:signal peptidase I
MEQLKIKFQSILEKYKQKRDYFKKTVDKWGQKKYKRDYEQGRALLQRAENYATSLLQEFSAPNADKKVLKSKVRDFNAVYKKLNESTKPVLQQWVEAIVIAVALAFLLRNFIFGLYHVPTGSAEPNILVGDRIWGNKMAYYFDDPKRGDLVIFDNPRIRYDKDSVIKYWWQKYIGLPIPLLGLSGGPDNWVKRVIAVSGDWIQGKVEDGKPVVYVNGKKVDEPYVNPYPLIKVRRSKGLIPLENFGPFNIPEFLRYTVDEHDYTYDPSTSKENQEFYHVKEEEIVKNLETGEPFFKNPYNPSYSFDYDTKSFYCADVFGPFKVPEGKYWVMGDSRKNSQDSRWWHFLDKERVHGRASFIIYSIDSEEAFWLFELIKHPISFWTKSLRWNRFFRPLWGHNGKE